jgi:hypothetical protein
MGTCRLTALFLHFSSARLQGCHVTGPVLSFCETSGFGSELFGTSSYPENALNTAEGSVEGQGDARADAVGSALQHSRLWLTIVKRPRQCGQNDYR